MATLHQLTIGINPAQRNQYLFSKHYLDICWPMTVVNPLS